jgi:nitrate/nitrite-specific signal transduction histidine kinase
MRERAEAIGAQLTITSRPQGGTTIAVEWQFPRQRLKWTPLCLAIE